jgi:RimJ/RimL family protein N-acetyltransferase
LLEGKNFNLRVADKKDVPLLAKWWSNEEYLGEYQDIMSLSEAELEKRLFETPWMSGLDTFFIIEKKDGTRIGHITSFVMGEWRGKMEIGYAIVPSERGKGYGTEAVKLMIDYLFTKKNVIRIQVTTHADNISSQKVLEKVGFQREGLMRKSTCVKGKYHNEYIYGILREEWQKGTLSY